MIGSHRQRDAVDDLPQVIDGVDVDAVAAAVTGCPSVAGVSGGSFGATTSLLPGRRVSGVRVQGGEVRVEVRVRWGATAAAVSGEIRAATVRLLAGHRLHVVIGDIDLPSSETDRNQDWPDDQAPAALPGAPAAAALAGPASYQPKKEQF